MKSAFNFKKLTYNLLAASFMVVVGIIGFSSAAYAATITVDSTSDTTVTDGACTLREAISNANSNSDTTSGDCVAGQATVTAQDVINFNIAGSGVQTIVLTGANNINVTEGLTIDGYSQPGASPNTNPMPQPFNANILIEIDDQTTSGNNTLFFNNADLSVIQGIALGGGGYGIGHVNSSNVTFTGNMIGFFADGSANAIANDGLGYQEGSDDAQIGGLNPADRNVIGNAGGNCVGVSNYSDTTPAASDRAKIEGNFVGIGPDGTTVASCDSAGIQLLESSDSIVGGPTAASQNIVGNGIGIGVGVAGGDDNTVQNNIIGFLADGTTATSVGIGLFITQNSTVPHRTMVLDNLIGNASTVGLFLFGAQDSVVQGNQIGTNINGEVINDGYPRLGLIAASDNLIGGTSAGQGNVIAGNGGNVNSGELFITTIPTTLPATGNSFIGNSIYGSQSGPDLDLGQYIDSDGDYQTDSIVNTGPALNDAGDSDTGSNNYINFPVLNSVVQDGTQATINFDLDAADSPTDSYRVEFFANDEANATGYGGGQTFLGAITTSNGTDLQQTITLPTNTDLNGKSISATTTAIDATTDSGFGSTSEFSLVLLADVTNAPQTSGAQTSSSSTLANTGDNLDMYLLISIATLGTGLLASTRVLRSKEF